MVNAFHEMMPKMLNTIAALSESHEEKAIECYELFEELCDNAATVISPHLKNLIAMSLTIAQNKSLGNELRVKAIAVVGCLVRTKKKAIVKNKLVEPIIGEKNNFISWLNSRMRVCKFFLILSNIPRIFIVLFYYTI